MKRRPNFIAILGVLLILSSILYFLHLKVEETNKRKEALETERKFIRKINNKDKTKKQVLEFKYTKDKEKQNIADEISSDEAIGVIRVDKLGILAEIYDNTLEYTLLKGVGVIDTTDFPSSKLGTVSALAGHRGGRNEKLSFLNIHKLEYGDEIKVTTKNEVIKYIVKDQEVIEPDDWSKFTREKDKSKLILMACHPYPQNHQRLLVKTELEKKENGE